MATESNHQNSDDKSTDFEFSKFIFDLCRSLRCSKALQIGIEKNNDLMGFSENLEIHSINSNDDFLAENKEKRPLFNFVQGFPTQLPYPDSFFDFVFFI